LFCCVLDLFMRSAVCIIIRNFILVDNDCKLLRDVEVCLRSSCFRRLWSRSVLVTIVNFQWQIQRRPHSLWKSWEAAANEIWSREFPKITAFIKNNQNINLSYTLLWVFINWNFPKNQRAPSTVSVPLPLCQQISVSATVVYNALQYVISLLLTDLTCRFNERMTGWVHSLKPCTAAEMWVLGLSFGGQVLVNISE